MEELERLPEWAGRKAETRVSKETWSAAEVDQPLVSLEVEEPNNSPDETLPSRHSPAEAASVTTMETEPPRRGRWLIALGTLSLIAGIGAGVLYMAITG